MAIDAAMVLDGSHHDLDDTMATITTDPAPKFSQPPPCFAPVGQRLAYVAVHEKIWKSPFPTTTHHHPRLPFCHRRRDPIPKTIL